MAVRRQRSTTKKDIISNNIKDCVREGKIKYRNSTDEFYVYEAYEGSGYFFVDSTRLSEKFEQHWVFNHDKKRWECLGGK